MTGKIKILIVDDRVENLLALEAILDSAVYELIRAHSGSEALRQVLEYDFALILLDVQMPDLDGYETARLIRTREKSAHIPIIFITANYQAEKHISRGYELGAIDYILKPVNPANLRYKVARFVDLYQHQEKRLEQEIQRSDQLRILGEMAAGVSHEIRNPITGVKAYLQLLKGKTEFSSYRNDIDIMIDELERVNVLVNEFLSLGRLDSSEMKMLNLNTIVNALAPLISADGMRQGKILKVETNPVFDLFLNNKEIRQMILNLCRNGFDAMLPVGCLLIKTFVENNDVVLAVKDQGKGIKPEILKNLGTPFLTDKENGNGLGLSICYSIALRHNATIEVDTSSNGTTFYVKFRLNKICQ
ncbi:response regulator [Desulfosporosinus sp. SB140]|uniref:response regulator n=1 Tax=Desulfosporosinus paludis TaxID=3115649 RepID=UPI00388D1C7C